jgi:hypothetical protein
MKRTFNTYSSLFKEIVDSAMTNVERLRAQERNISTTTIFASVDDSLAALAFTLLEHKLTGLID